MRFFKVLFFASVMTMLLWSCPLDPHPPASPDIRGVILFIGDGMGLPSENLTSRYLYGREHALAWDAFPGQAWVSTWDVSAWNTRAVLAGLPIWNTADGAVNDPLTGYDPAKWGTRPWPDNLQDGISDQIASLVLAATDSASAATAMSCGVKTDNGNIAWASGDAPGGALHSIGEYLATHQDMELGIISTVPISHATPAAFAAHNTSRSNYQAIAREMVMTTRPRVLLGGGCPAWTGTTWLDANLVDDAVTSGDWTVVQRKAGVNGNESLLRTAAGLGPDMRLLGLFGGSDGAWEAPVPQESPGSPGFARVNENPSLAAAVHAALEVLQKSGKGFFLMVEQGDIDWANHANTLPRMIGATASLDEAVRSCIAWLDQPGDSLSADNVLVLVTADHATGALRYNPDAPAIAGSLAFDGMTYHYGGHSNELVGMHVWGSRSGLLDSLVGLEYPETRIMDNTRIFTLIRQAAGP